MALTEQIKHAWNAFRNKANEVYEYVDRGITHTRRPDTSSYIFRSDKSIVSSIITRIAIDCAAIDIRHARVDDNDRFIETIPSGLNYCLSVEANIDQAATHFRQNLVQALLEKGVIAIVPVDTTINPQRSGSFDILTMRVGEVTEWSSREVRVRLWNEARGDHEEIWVSKRHAAIIENPLYRVMNEPNSMLQRLNRKLQLLDAVDEASSSNKLDLIIQLPYVIKSEARQKQAEERRKSIEMQLKTSQYGIAYTDGTERVTQLNRPAENKLLRQVEYLTKMVYGQLGLAEEVFDGTADAATMTNYYNRTVEPILTALVEGMARVFLTKTARSQKQAIKFFRDPFRLIPVTEVAEMADKLTRNEIMSTNEIRGVIGLKPSSDPKADELRNKNLPAPAEAEAAVTPPDETERTS